MLGSLLVKLYTVFTMNIVDWHKKRLAILEIISYLDSILPTISVSMGTNVFAATMGLYYCNRLLRAIDSAVESRLGDTSGGNLRTLYETWIYSHLLLLADRKEIVRMQAGTRYSNQKVTDALGISESIFYPEDSPEAMSDIDVRSRASSLKQKLEICDPQNANMPIQCYDSIYRAESLMSTHANLTAIASYSREDKNGVRTIGLHNKDKDNEWRTLLAADITIYFALQLFKKAKLDCAELKHLDNKLSEAHKTI